MADQIYSPVVTDDDDQTETPSPRAELDIPDPAEFRRQLDDGRDELTVEEGASQRQRQPDPESPESAYERPLVHIKAKGTEAISLDEASDAIRWGRAYRLGQDLRQAGLSERQIGEMADDLVARGERIDPVMPPEATPEAKVLEEYGEDKRVLTPAEAADELTNWRARHQEAQQQELAELAGEAAQHAQAEAQAQQPQPEPQQQPQAPDPVQTERQQLAQERQQLASLKRSEGAEVVERIAYDQLRNQVVAEFPSLRTALPTPEQIEDLRVRDPNRFHRLAQYDQALRERQARIGFLTQQREQSERQQAQVEAQQRAAARAEQDAHFERLASQHIPNWERNHAEVRAQARATLENAGLSPEEIHHLWHGNHTIDAHSSVLQLVLAKAAMYDRMQTRAHEIRQAPVPPVMRPGTYRARDDGAQSVRDLQMQLKGAKGRDALRIATEITRARRANGG
jgi:hypothetical protein